MLKEVEHELYILINQIEYHSLRYEDYQHEINELETKIHLLKNVKNF